MSSTRGLACAYCGKPAVNEDHVVPKSLRRRVKQDAAWRKRRMPRSTGYAALREVPAELLKTVPACFGCNIRKGSRRLVPPSWASKVPLLNEYFPGVPWRVWTGGVDEPAYAEVHR